MPMNKKKSIDYWVELIAKEELPAIASTVKVLEKFSNDDKSSLPMLSKSILHDQSLSSCILKVANSGWRVSHTQVSTVSRATVVLGIHAVKNICLTSTLLDSLFESKKLTPNSYQKLTELMARSFYAAVLAKMLVSDYNEDTQEEVYLASMLYTIGETAFWSVGGESADRLLSYQHLPAKEYDDICQKTIGCTFNDISKLLGKKWGLGNLLEKSLDNPEYRTSEIRIIYLANKLSALIMQPPESGDELLSLLDEISKLKKIKVSELKHRISLCREQTIKLLSFYGAKPLEDNIKPLPVINHSELKGKALLSYEQKLLIAIKKLTTLTRTTNDINHYCETVLKELLEVFDLDQTTLYIFTQDKKTLKARFQKTKKNAKKSLTATVALGFQPNIISYMVKTDSNLFVDNYRDKKWLNYIPNEIKELVSNGPTFLALVKINNRTIGMVAGQENTEKLFSSKGYFDDFCFVIEHLNMCLSSSSNSIPVSV